MFIATVVSILSALVVLVASIPQWVNLIQSIRAQRAERRRVPSPTIRASGRGEGRVENHENGQELRPFCSRRYSLGHDLCWSSMAVPTVVVHTPSHFRCRGLGCWSCYVDKVKDQITEISDSVAPCTIPPPAYGAGDLCNFLETMRTLEVYYFPHRQLVHLVTVIMSNAGSLVI